MKIDGILHDIIQYFFNTYPELTQDEFLQRRREGIGGTETSALMGCNKYMTAVELYEHKRMGLHKPESIPMKRGKYMEPFIAQLFSEDTGQPCFQLGRRIINHPVQQYSFGTLDALSVDKDGNIHVIDFKSVVGRGAYEWYASIPAYITVQIQKYIWIITDIIRSRFKKYKGRIYGGLAILVDDQYIGEYYITQNERTLQIIQEADRKFWEDCWLKEKMPDPQTVDDLRIMYRNLNKDSQLEADGEMLSYLEKKLSLAERRNEITKMTGELENEEEEIMYKILEKIGSYEFVVYEGEILASYSANKNGIRSLRLKPKVMERALTAHYQDLF